MQKSIHSPEYKILVRMMREARERNGVTQAIVAERLGITASQLSKWERRERRIDMLEFAQYCQSADIDPVELFARWLSAKNP